MSSLPLVILTAGNNSRFFPLNSGSHKGFFELCGEPLIVNLLRNAETTGIKKVFIIVSERDNSENTRNSLQKLGLNLEIEFLEQKEALGMGDALLLAKDHINSKFLVASPYHVNSSATFLELIKKQHETDANCILVGTHTENPERYGVLTADGDKVTDVTEKPQQPISNIKLSSIYLLSNEMLAELAELETAEYSFETALNNICQTKDVRWIESKQELPTLKYAWDLFQIKTLLLADKKSQISPTAQIRSTVIIDDSHGPVTIADGADIKDFVTIIGPTYIGKNALVGNYSMIRESCIEKDCVVGAYTEIVRSILSSGVKIHQSYCSDSILGPNTRVGAGLITANKRLDRDKIFVMIKGKLLNTRVSNLGLVTGENTQLGIGVRSMPGTLLGSETQVYPDQQIAHTIEPSSTVKINGKQYD